MTPQCFLLTVLNSYNSGTKSENNVCIYFKNRYVFNFKMSLHINSSSGLFSPILRILNNSWKTSSLQKMQEKQKDSHSIVIPWKGKFGSLGPSLKVQQTEQTTDVGEFKVVIFKNSVSLFSITQATSSSFRRRSMLLKFFLPTKHWYSCPFRENYQLPWSLVAMISC